MLKNYFGVIFFNNFYEERICISDKTLCVMTKKGGKRKLDDIVENLKHPVDKKAKPSVMADSVNEAGSSEKDIISETGETSLCDLKSLMQQISKDIISSEKKLATRIDSLESDLEGKLYNRIHELITTTVRAEIDELRREYCSEIEGLKTKISQLEKSYADAVKCNGSPSGGSESRAQFEERKKRIVVRNLPQGANETPQIVMDKLNAMIRDGCKLTDVTVTAAERKTSAGRKPGVIIASIDTFPQKQKLMKSKSALKKTVAYKRVFIDNDYCSETRKIDSNLRTILKEIGKNKQYRVEGEKLFPLKSNNENAGDSRTGTVGSTD